MRRVVLLLLCTAALFSAERLIVGGGPYLQTRPYMGADPVALFSPVIFYNETPFYVRWTWVGVYVLGEQGEEASRGASLTLEPMIPGDYTAATLTDLHPRKKTAVLAGLEERPSSWEGGLALSAERGDLYGEVMVLQDVLGRNNSPASSPSGSPSPSPTTITASGRTKRTSPSAAVRTAPMRLSTWLFRPMSNTISARAGASLRSSVPTGSTTPSPTAR